MTLQLSIKSLEYQVKIVSVPPNASVLDLKRKIKEAFDVDTLRQRLIFQGKVLKDEKNLLDYENLKDGKVVHLIVRPIHVSHHPDNDESMRQTDTTRAGRLSFLSSAMTNLQLSLTFMAAENSSFSASRRSGLFPQGSTTNRPFHDIFRQRRTQLGDWSDVLDILDTTRPSPDSLPIPSSLDLRLSRILSYIRETRSIMRSPLSTARTETRPSISPSTIHESRQILRQHPNHASQLSFVLQELADLYDACVPYLTEIRRSLTQQQEPQQLAHVLRTARILHMFNICQHFLSSVLYSMQSYHPVNETWTSSASSHQRSHQATETPSSSSNRSGMKRKRDDGDAGPSSRR